MQVISLIQHFFVPHRSNNQKARLIHSEVIMIIAMTVLLFQSVINLGVHSNIGILGYAANISVEEVISLTNRERQNIGVTELKYNAELSEAARQKGLHMLELDYWAHVGPDGTQPWKFFENVGYSYRYAGENLARDFTNPSSTVSAWMASPSHRDNLLSDKYTEIGVAVVEGDMNGVDTTLVVQLFGLPSGAAPTVPTVAAAAENNFIAEAKAEEETQPDPIAPAVELVERVELDDSDDIAFEVISPFIATRTISLFIIGLLSVVLIIDIIEVERRGVSRVGGRKMAHLAYLFTLIVIVVISKAGEIL